MMRYYRLDSLRYSTIFRSIVLIDMIIEISLWITGAILKLNVNELDQIIKFHFTNSMFDIILLSSFKTLILYICITELENVSLKIISRSREQIIVASTSVNDRASTETQNQYACYLEEIKKGLQLAIFIFTFVCFSYVIIKFSFILKDIIPSSIKKQSWNIDFGFTIICVELIFSIIEFLLACMSWFYMRKLSTIALTQMISAEIETNQEKKKVNLRRLISLSYPERYYLAIAFIMLVVASVTNIIVPYFFGAVVDSALNYPDLKEMNRYIFYLIIVFLLGSIAGGLRSWLFELAGQRVVARLRKQVFEAIIKQDVKFFDINRTGELTSRISSDTQVLQSAVTVNVSMLLRYIIQIFGSVAFMFSLEASLTGVLLGVIPIVTLLTVQYGRRLKKFRKKFQDELAASSVISEEAISSVRTVRSFAAEKRVSDQFSKTIDRSYQIGKKLAIAQGGFFFLIGLLTAGALAIVLWYGGKLVHDKKITTGLLASFLMYTLQVAMAFAFLTSLYGDFMQALGASQRIFELIDTVPSISLDKGRKPIDQEELFDGSIIFDNVHFSYPSRLEAKVLKSVNLVIEKGKTLALVGPSGGGKSTIFSLIERFYDPDLGVIYLGPSNTPIKEININWLHSKIALVSQEPVLFGGTIKENICFGLDNNCLDEKDLMNRVIEAAKLANAHDFIISFENGYETLVGERGIRLSGGQKQRIAIARALLIDPKLLLLDEATSALDAESEHLVQEAIDRAMRNRTVCVIAHRLSTVRNANKVVVLEEGNVVEQGTHDELVAIDGIYKRLVLRQLLIKDPISPQSNIQKS